MKKSYFLIPELILISLSLNAQGNIFPSSGNVGIGTTAPAEKLSIEGGGIQLSNPAAYPYGMSIDLSMPDYTGGWAREYCFTYNKVGKLFSLGVYVGNKELHYGYIGGNSSGSIVYSQPWMVFRPNGDIGIGTLTPQSKLAVNGTVTAKQVTVTQTGWADFVFDSTYDLKPLLEIERYIRSNKHLPGIPSANQIAEEGNDLGKTDAQLLQKIEELTLYLIRQQKEMLAQNERMDLQRQLLRQQEKRIKMVEQLLAEKQQKAMNK